MTIFLVGLGVQAEDPGPLSDSLLEVRLDSQSPQRSHWFIEPHRPNYVLPISYIKDPSESLQPQTSGRDGPAEAGVNGDKMQEFEVKFQLSLQLAVAKDLIAHNGDLYVAYTQISVWQAYNSDISSPFRDTNYEPEGFLSFDTDLDIWGLRMRMVQLGAVHQSNGRSDLLSRSWNRIYANFVMERGHFACSLKPWWRLPESAASDNNPYIEDYYGYGEFRAAYKWKSQVFAALLRNNLKVDDNKGAVELNWCFPLTGQIKGFVQYFNGFGETLLDYNERDERIGLGFLLANWI